MRRDKKRLATLHKIEGLVFAIAAVGLLAAGGYLYKKQRETQTQINPEAYTVEEETDRLFDQNTVTYNGKTYRRNTYIKAILCMGVDRTGSMEETTTTGFGGQADALILAAYDTAHESVKLMMIPRDTMTDIILTDLSGNILGKGLQHLTLAYAYGDGREKSCEYTAEAVSDLLEGLPIDDYMSADVDVISILNDFVGGVTVTIPTEGMEAADPEFVYGSTVTLKGKQAEKFVRYRDTTRDHSALYRMDQQQEYMEQFFETVKTKMQTDEDIVSEMFDEIQEYMVTDMEKADYLKMAMSCLNTDMASDDVIYTLPGEGVTTAKYDEFYPDTEGMRELVLKLFYREEQ